MQSETDTNITFDSLQLAEPILRALHEKNYDTPSPIQAQAIPPVMEGRDLMGIAQTGTGKTAAFCLPLLHRLAQNPQRAGANRFRALVLTPTRELAAQIGQNLALYGKHLNLRHAIVFGGVGQHPQVRSLRQGVDILIATPGRLLDLHQQGHIKFDKVEIFILDEADCMLDMGFIHDVKKVTAAIPARRQSLFLSATLAPAISELANTILRDPARVTIAAKQTTAKGIEQQMRFVNADDKLDLLQSLIEEQGENGLTLVFNRTKHGAKRLAEQLNKRGIPADSIHGNKSQAARSKTLDFFRKGKTRVLVATDVAARGIDVKNITLVVNHDLPEDCENYVHRIGRTARAGAEGVAVSFCSEPEVYYLREIEKLIRRQIPTEREHEFHAGDVERLHLSGQRVPKPTRGGGGQRGQRQGQPRPQRDGFFERRNRGEGNPAKKRRSRNRRRTRQGAAA